MTRIAAILLALICTLPVPAFAATCGNLASGGMVTVNGYDPLGSGVVETNFQLQFDTQEGSPFYIQFIDRNSGVGASRVGASGPGPYDITPLGRPASLIASDAIVPPRSMADGGNWVRVNPGQRGAASILNLRFFIREGYLPAGVYAQNLDVRIACPIDASFSYDTIPDGLSIQVAVDNNLRVVPTTAASTIALGTLSVTGGPTKGSLPVSISAAGPFNISVVSQNAISSSEREPGLLVREGSNPSDTSSQIPYRIEIDRQRVGSGRQLRCAGRVGELSVDIATGDAPAAGKRAGNYSDRIEVTLTPDFNGAPVGDGCVAAN